MIEAIKDYFFNLNFFQSSDPNHQQDQHERRSDIITTRLYLIIFSIILFILILALWLTPQILKSLFNIQLNINFNHYALMLNVHILKFHFHMVNLFQSKQDFIKSVQVILFLIDGLKPFFMVQIQQTFIAQIFEQLVVLSFVH